MRDQEVKASLDQLRLTERPTYQMFQFKKARCSDDTFLQFYTGKDQDSRRSILSPKE